jgi:tripartite ATP-independent transporter DctP family solute receptor
MSRRARLATLTAALALAAGLALAHAALAAAPAPEFIIKLATVAPADSPWSALLEKYKTEVETKSAGRVAVKLKLGGALGDENETVLKCKRGTVEAVGASTGALASLVPELNVVELPFLFETGEQADYVIDGVLTAKLDPLFKERGLVLGFWSENGFRHFGTKDKFVKSPADLKGKKMRSQESPVHMAMYRAFGASPVPIPTTEVPTALATGSVDGFDQSALYTIAASWHKSIKYFTVTGHIYQPAAIAFNKEFFEKLPPELQKLLIDEGRAIQSKGRKGVRKIFPDLLDILRKDGVEVYTLTPAERVPFVTASRVVYDEFRKTHGKVASALLDDVLKSLKTAPK